ncbi:MAG: DUF4058 family protein [Gemmataceae bacterium]
MPSPFPGMDPYLENPVYWGGLHGNLITRIQASLNKSLPKGWYAELDDFVWLEADEDEERRLLGKPDSFLIGRNGAHTPSSSATVVAAPVRFRMPVAKKRKTKHVKVVAPDHSRVVTVIEVLSPANKQNKEGREKYVAKREDYLASGVHLVEIDLLRLGERFVDGSPQPPDADYYLFVCRAEDYPGAEVWPFTVREPIPSFEVPLNQGQAGPVLDLRSCLDEIYDTNRYSSRVDYTLPPVPPLRSLDAEWAADLLEKAARKRKK